MRIFVIALAILFTISCVTVIVQQAGEDNTELSNEKDVDNAG